uniref:radical SAM/SPASM domain-containing protein n=1 Tax=Eubacterium cellulosolvens TaxID=29322 RepID=UPI00054D69BA|nr:radical SAM protein [[Eubacterium] cellulosolvens]
MGNTKYIHLLYVPTMACNLACRYCYLEDETKDGYREIPPLDTLKYAVEKFEQSGAKPFNISLHGGEVTTLAAEPFRELIRYISEYYDENREELTAAGYRVGQPHIKTNLYDLDRHLDTIRDYEVSISGSLDLPLSLHEHYRVTKGGSGTLDRILANIELLRGLPGKKKVSATLFREHFEHLDEMIRDIHMLHEKTPLDMNDFNFMIGFDYNSGGMLTPMSGEEQVELFRRMHEEFDGTDLDEGVNGAWFNEFGPEYCTNCDDCGDKFFLLEKNGDIYSCVRGQKHEEFYYGNIYRHSVEEMFETAHRKIIAAHRNLEFPEECGRCGWLYLCKTGCPFVKNVYRDGKSYTCELQKELYKRREYEYRPDPETIYSYVRNMRPEVIQTYLPEARVPEEDEGTSLLSIIRRDERLKGIYDSGAFVLNVDGADFSLESQILKQVREFVYLADGLSVKLYIRKDMLDLESPYPQNNSLYMMLLSGDTITYGDEGRTKQAHLMTHQIYKGVLEKLPSDREGWYCVEIGPILSMYKDMLSKENPNNLFFTTADLRDVHYQKQRANAYYHMQAINLPFQNIEFYYLDLSGEEENYD